MALGFFRKQGFSEKMTMARVSWEGFIKDYDGGRLMECKIHPSVDYLNISTIIKM
jgi:histone acetyltransferase